MHPGFIFPSFEFVDFSRFKFPLITIYFNPSDFPNKYVARIYDANQPTLIAVVKDSLEELRSVIPKNFQRLERHVYDDPVIVEIWI